MKNLQDEINKIPFLNTDWGLIVIVFLVFIISSLVNNILGGFWTAVALSLILIAWKLPTVWKRLSSFLILLKDKLFALFHKKQ